MASRPKRERNLPSILTANFQKKIFERKDSTGKLSRQIVKRDHLYGVAKGFIKITKQKGHNGNCWTMRQKRIYYY